MHRFAEDIHADARHQADQRSQHHIDRIGGGTKRLVEDRKRAGMRIIAGVFSEWLGAVAGATLCLAR
jgi:hypothetical protein